MVSPLRLPSPNPIWCQLSSSHLLDRRLPSSDPGRRSSSSNRRPHRYRIGTVHHHLTILLCACSRSSRGPAPAVESRCRNPGPRLFAAKRDRQARCAALGLPEGAAPPSRSGLEPVRSIWRALRYAEQPGDRPTHAIRYPCEVDTKPCVGRPTCAGHQVPKRSPAAKDGMGYLVPILSCNQVPMWYLWELSRLGLVPCPLDVLRHPLAGLELAAVFAPHPIEERQVSDGPQLGAPVAKHPKAPLDQQLQGVGAVA